MDSLPNGGFPPIKYCNENNNKNNKVAKERFFSASIKNVNVRKILNSNVKKTVMFDDNDENNIEEIEEV